MPLTPPNSTPGSSPERSQPTLASTRQAMDIYKTSTKVVNGFTISVKEAALCTPPATPETSQNSGWVHRGANPALAFVQDIFPDNGKEAVRHATSVAITQEGVTWEGVVLALPGTVKTLYVNGKGAESVQLRESIVALLDLAGEHLDCEAFVIALDRNSPALAGLIHSLLYVSGTVVSKPVYDVDPKYVLVGIGM